MNLQEPVTTLMVTENNRLLSRVTPRFFSLWEGDTGVVNHYGEVFERAGLPWEEEQFCLVDDKLEVVGRHPS
jgi:hypothetical protein